MDFDKHEEEDLDSTIEEIFHDKKPKIKKSEDKNYWTSETEKSLLKYVQASTIPERNKIYEEELKKPFEKLVENIFNTFKFTYFDCSPQQVQSDCISHLVSNIEKFNHTTGKGKSFGYFSITAKHFFILINNANFRKWKNHDSIDPTPEHPKELIIDTNKKDNQCDMIEFIKLMVSYWEDNVKKMFTKKRDLEIANAIIELFRQSDRIECFNKKALYLYIREIAGCKTQNITKVINRMKSSQASILNDYLEHGSIDRLRYKLKSNAVTFSGSEDENEENDED